VKEDMKTKTATKIQYTLSLF